MKENNKKDPLKITENLFKVDPKMAEEARKIQLSKCFLCNAKVGSDGKIYSQEQAHKAWEAGLQKPRMFLLTSQEHAACKECAANMDKLLGKKCFIATAAYGSPMASEVLYLRSFRDEILQRSKLGKIFIQMYYTVSPKLAKHLSNMKHMRAAVRFLLFPIISICKRCLQNKSRSS